CDQRAFRRHGALVPDPAAAREATGAAVVASTAAQKHAVDEGAFENVSLLDVPSNGNAVQLERTSVEDATAQRAPGVICNGGMANFHSAAVEEGAAGTDGRCVVLYERRVQDKNAARTHDAAAESEPPVLLAARVIRRYRRAQDP